MSDLYNIDIVEPFYEFDLSPCISPLHDFPDAALPASPLEEGYSTSSNTPVQTSPRHEHGQNNTTGASSLPFQPPSSPTSNHKPPESTLNMAIRRRLASPTPLAPALMPVNIRRKLYTGTNVLSPHVGAMSRHSINEPATPIMLLDDDEEVQYSPIRTPTFIPVKSHSHHILSTQRTTSTAQSYQQHQPILASISAVNSSESPSSDLTHFHLPYDLSIISDLHRFVSLPLPISVPTFCGVDTCDCISSSLSSSNNFFHFVIRRVRTGLVSRFFPFVYDCCIFVCLGFRYFVLSLVNT